MPTHPGELSSFSPEAATPPSGFSPGSPIPEISDPKPAPRPSRVLPRQLGAGLNPPRTARLLHSSLTQKPEIAKQAFLDLLTQTTPGF